MHPGNCREEKIAGTGSPPPGTRQPSRRIVPLALQALLVAGFLAFSGCSNLPFVKQNKAPTRLYLTDFSTAWTAALEAVSAGKDVIRVQNRETGIIETGWIDNSESRNFLEVFSDEDFFLRSRYKLQVHVREGKKNGQQATLVRIVKYPQLQSTFLGNWQDVETDGLDEAVYLYRIGRLIAIAQYNEDQDKEDRQMVDKGETLFF
jgi:NlpB/DapX lipoprotein